MKYKCIEEKWIEDIKIMDEGDIIVVNGDQIYNITKSKDIKNIPFEWIKSNLVNIVDECVGVSEPKMHPFEEITKSMFETYLRKNKDYGNSFDQSLDKWGLSVAAIRLGDKLNRFESYIKNGSFAVNDEGVRDTLMDLSCYSIMTIMYLNSKQNGKN